MDKLADYENATERALGKLETQLSNAEADIQNSLDHTITLPDGRKIFRDADGQVWDEHENRIDEETAASIEWQGSEPGYETFLEQRKKVQELRNSIHDVRIYQTDVLGNAREQLTDPDNPASAELINKLENDITEQAPQFVRAENKQDRAPAPETPDRSSDIEILNLGANSTSLNN